jgi:hypothetical protein
MISSAYRMSRPESVLLSTTQSANEEQELIPKIRATKGPQGSEIRLHHYNLLLQLCRWKKVKKGTANHNVQTVQAFVVSVLL